MRRRAFLKAGGVTALLAGARAYPTPVHNFDGYDFGPGPNVAERLYQGPFPAERFAGWQVVMATTASQEIIPGITCYTGGKHTFQSQFVGVNTKAGTVVLASDNMYLYENLEKHAPIAQTLDAASNLRAQDRMKQLAASPRLIVPGHDPVVFERFPKVSERTVKIE